MEQFIKQPVTQKVLHTLNNSKIDILMFVFFTLSYCMLNFVDFSNARKNTTYILYIEKESHLNIEKSMEISPLLQNLSFYVMQIFAWTYVISTYFYRNNTEYKFKFWSITLFYFSLIFGFPCYSMNHINHIPYLENIYSNGFYIDTSLLTLSILHKAPRKSKYYFMFSIPLLYSILHVLLLHKYCFIELISLTLTFVYNYTNLKFLKSDYQIDESII